MALIKCAECGKEISDKAAACVGCGAPVATPATGAPAAPPATHSNEPRQLDNGRWEWGGQQFDSKVSAELHQVSRDAYADPPEKKKGIGCGSVILACAAGLIAFSFVQHLKSSGNSRGSYASSRYTASDAHTECEFMLKRLTKDPEKAVVPYIKGTEYADSFSFSWNTGTKLIRTRNGLGLEVGVAGECAVNKTSRKITRIVFDGQVIDFGAKP